MEASEEHRRRWESFATRLRRELNQIGLRADADYWLEEPHGLDQNSVVGVNATEQVTPDLLLACDRAVRDEHDWGVIIVTVDPFSQRLVPLVQTNGGMFTLLSGGPRISKVIYEAVKKRGDDWLQYVRSPTDAG